MAFIEASEIFTKNADLLELEDTLDFIEDGHLTGRCKAPTTVEELRN